MNTRARVIYGSSLAVIFLAGVLLGGVGMRARFAYKYPFAFHSGTELVNIWMRKLDRRLHLSAAQEAVIRPELEQTMENVAQARQQLLLATRESMQQTDQAIHATLTDTQRVTYAQLLEERKRSEARAHR